MGEWRDERKKSSNSTLSYCIPKSCSYRRLEKQNDYCSGHLSEEDHEDNDEELKEHVKEMTC